MENQLTIAGSTELEKVITDSGLQLNEAEEIKSSYLPFLIQFSEIKELSAKINTENPTELDEKIARDLRLKTVKIRTGADALKADRKRIYLIKGDLEQASFNVIKNTCLLAEAEFEKTEKARAIKEAERIAELKAQRLEILSEFTESANIYPLGEMTDESFNDLLSGFKLQKEAKEKAEKERIEAEKLLAEQKEKERIAYEAEQERIRIENEKLKKEAEAKEKELQKERELAAKKLQEQQAKAKAEAEKLKAENDAKLKAEKERADKIAAELKAKQDAELKAQKEADEAEAKRIADEKKLSKATDKVKLNKWLEDNFETPVIFALNISTESEKVQDDIMNKFSAFKKWALTTINEL